MPRSTSHIAIPREPHISIGDRLRCALLFADMPEALLSIFADAASVKQYSKGKVLFLHEDAADYFYVIANGWVKLFRETLDGEEAVIDVLNEGHIFGETSMFEDGMYSYGAEVVENATIIALPLALLKQHILQDPTLSMKMFSVMSRFRRQQDQELEHRDLQSAPQRIGCFLLRLCKPDSKGAITLYLPYDKSLIASRLGMKPETFSRALSRLRSETGIRIHGSKIELDSIEQLSNYSCSACSSAYPCQDLH